MSKTHEFISMGEKKESLRSCVHGVLCTGAYLDESGRCVVMTGQMNVLEHSTHPIRLELMLLDLVMWVELGLFVRNCTSDAEALSVYSILTKRFCAIY